MKYGSDQYDVQEVPVLHIGHSADRRVVSLNLPVIKAGYVYELTLTDITSESGVVLENKLICYTVNKIVP